MKNGYALFIKLIDKLTINTVYAIRFFFILSLPSFRKFLLSTAELSAQFKKKRDDLLLHFGDK